MMLERITTFARDETGAATTDWMVLTAGVTLLGLSAVTVVRITITEHAGDRVESVVVSGAD